MALPTAAQRTQISASSPEKGPGLLTWYFLKAIKDGKGDSADIYEQLGRSGRTSFVKSDASISRNIRIGNEWLGSMSGFASLYPTYQLLDRRRARINHARSVW
jgi:hypothetical protein